MRHEIPQEASTYTGHWGTKESSNGVVRCFLAESRKSERTIEQRSRAECSTSHEGELVNTPQLHQARWDQNAQSLHRLDLLGLDRNGETA